MGRKPEFKVSKAFTIGMQEAGFLAEKSHSMGMKASQYINWLLRQEMLEEMQREPSLPVSTCEKCFENGDPQSQKFDFKDEIWLCLTCGNDKTYVIESIIEYSNKFKKS